LGGSKDISHVKKSVSLIFSSSVLERAVGGAKGNRMTPVYLEKQLLSESNKSCEQRKYFTECMFCNFCISKPGEMALVFKLKL